MQQQKEERGKQFGFKKALAMAALNVDSDNHNICMVLLSNYLTIACQLLGMYYLTVMRPLLFL